MLRPPLQLEQRYAIMLDEILAARGRNVTQLARPKRIARLSCNILPIT